MSAVTASGASAEAGAGLCADLVEFGCVRPGEAETRLCPSDAAGVRFESCAPVRGFPSRKGQRHFPGRWWTATTGRHIGYESWLERDHLMLLDFDPAVVGIASQPFWLFWPKVGDGPRAHAPDYFARRADGSALVLDCRPAQRIRPRDATVFAATKDVCARLGWDYLVVDAPDPVLTGNVRWLAGYRHGRHYQPAVAAALRTACTDGLGVAEAAEAVGDPIAVLPVLFHLLWQGELTVDLTVALNPQSALGLGPTRTSTGLVALDAAA